MTLIIDNYDSFSYNLYQYVGEIDPDVKVVRNDALSLSEIAALSPKRIILSPGPGRPEDAGICIDLIKRFEKTIPILGVCLGHQAVCAALGGRITYAKQLMHGKASLVTIDRTNPLFSGLPGQIKDARYHSLAAAKEALPDSLSVIAETEDEEIMAVAHREYPVYGLQFHPESILTPDGKTILKNFISLTENQKGDYHD